MSKKIDLENYTQEEIKDLAREGRKPYAKKYREAHREEIRQYSRQWHKDHPEKQKEYLERFYARKQLEALQGK